MMSKKIISLLLSVLMLVSVLSVSAFAMEAETLETEHYSGTMTVSASAESVQVGDTFTVTVGITAADVAALKLEFAYDETVFEFVSGAFCENTPNKDNPLNANSFSSSACVWVAYAGVGLLGGKDLSGDFATITFKTLKETDSASIAVSAQGGTRFEKYIDFDNASASVKVTAGDEPEIILGDANGDGFADSMDAALILQYEVGLSELDEVGLIAGDVNGDGYVDSMDAALILQYEVGIETGYGIDEPIAG